MAQVLARKFTKMDQIQGLLATTCNNYACYWRRMSTRSGIKMKQRLSCLNNVRRCIEQAVLLEAMSGQAINGPGTLINFGTVSFLPKYNQYTAATLSVHSCHTLRD